MEMVPAANLEKSHRDPGVHENLRLHEELPVLEQSSRLVGHAPALPSSFTQMNRETSLITYGSTTSDAVYTRHKREKPLGNGASGAVYLVNQRDHAYAMKEPNVSFIEAMHKKGKSPSQVWNHEIQILRDVGAPKNNEWTYLVDEIEPVSMQDKQLSPFIMTLATGGELFEHIWEHGKLREQQSASLMRQLTKNTYLLHQRSTCHLDLKLENVMFISDKNKENILRGISNLHDNDVMIVDFGAAQKMEGNEMVKDCGGTAEYVAPEVILGARADTPINGAQADAWSLYVIWFMLATGETLWASKTKDAMFSEIINFEGLTTVMEHKGIPSSDTMDIINELMLTNSEHRPTVGEVSDVLTRHYKWSRRNNRYQTDLKKVLKDIKAIVARRKGVKAEPRLFKCFRRGRRL